MFTMNKEVYNKVLLILIVLCSVGFYYIRFGPLSIVRVIEVLSLALIIIHLFLYGVYREMSREIKTFYRNVIIFIILGVLISSISANYYHYQSFSET